MPESPPLPPAAVEPVRVWDLPTRLFHWLLAAAVVGSVVSAKVGGNAMAWHFRCGYVVITLLAFRLLWGLVGGRWSRFASFVYAPATTWLYLRGRVPADAHADVGHSPLGALSVFALLAVLIVQVATGLVGDDEIANVGPLNRFVATDTGLAATSWHSTWGQGLVIGLVLLHVAALAVYRWRGRHLVPAMVVGDKLLPAGTPASLDSARERLLALALFAAVAGGVAYGVVRLGAW